MDADLAEIREELSEYVDMWQKAVRRNDVEGNVDEHKKCKRFLRKRRCQLAAFNAVVADADKWRASQQPGMDTENITEEVR